MKKGIIYKTTNLINGKFYVGKDQNNNPDYLGSGLLLVKAIKKYGRENFVKVILEECLIEELSDREIYWIAELNAILNGYNIAIGGKGGDTRAGYTEEQYLEWKAKKSAAQTGKIVHAPGPRPKQSKVMKELHASGKYSYDHLCRPMSESNKLALIKGRMLAKHDVVCERCGRSIPHTHIKPHMAGSRCIPDL
jgi:group I intron endonuclease